MNIILEPGLRHGCAPASQRKGEADCGRKLLQGSKGASTRPTDFNLFAKAEPHLLIRAVLSVGAFFSLVVAAYTASNRYRELAKVPSGELLRRGIPQGDLITEVSKILLKEVAPPSRASGLILQCLHKA
jgi:hypothetical protein